jgi:hypothetical protein
MSRQFDTNAIYRAIEDREYHILTDEEFAKKLLELGVPTHVTEWLVDAWRES